MNRLVTVTLSMLLAACGATSVSSSGITVPAGPALDAFDLKRRCLPADSSCTDLALRIAEAMFQEQGESHPPEAARAAAARPHLDIQVERDPPWEWRSADGSGGTSPIASIDLVPFFLAGDAAIVRFGDEGPGYAASLELTRQLVDALFVRDG